MVPLTVPLEWEKVPADEATETKVVLAGSGSFSETFVAAEGPVLLTIMV